VNVLRNALIFGILLVLFPLLTNKLSALSSDEILAAYKQIRNAPLDSSKVITVKDLVIKKDVAEFRLKKGSLYFQEPVLDHITGGVFIGEGIFRLTPPDKMKRKGLSRITEGKILELPFKELCIYFTDQTYAEVTKQISPGSGTIDSKAKKVLANLKKDLKEDFGWNIPARIAADYASGKPGKFFVAFFKDKDKYRFKIEPKHWEEITLYKYKSKRLEDFVRREYLYSADAMDEDSSFTMEVDTQAYRLDVILEKNQRLHGIEEVEFTSLVDSERMLHMNLSPRLRVESVYMGKAECSFIQEDKEEDADFWVLFPEPLIKGKTNTLTITYSGEKVVKNAGGGNYYVGSRISWYPNFGVPRDKALYRINYRVPKGKTILSTGILVNQWEDDYGTHSTWDSEIPFTVAGFNYGKFDVDCQKDSLIEVSCYTNRGLQDDLFVLKKALEESSWLRQELMMHPQELTTKKMTKDAAVQGYNAYNVFTHYFGEIPYRKIIISQQTSGSYGQSWPTLIYFPYTALLKPSVRDRFGLEEDFYKTVAAHEVAHQWWGHAVSNESYLDMWLSEGFAEYSAALYTQQVEGNKNFIVFIKNLREEILGKIEGGILNDVGPVCWGKHLNTIEGDKNYDLVYCKGAYILHMLRMMLYDYNNMSDDSFIWMMKDYVASHAGKNASNASFQAIVEKYFGQNMDWFFDQWVYGTDIPSYEYEYSATPSGDGKYILTISVTQKDVPYDFKMPFPFIVNFEKGHSVIKVETIGSFTAKREIKVPSVPKSIIPNPWESVLAVEVKNMAGK
jgi:hypothetical protein